MRVIDYLCRHAELTAVLIAGKVKPLLVVLVT
jgi:hypothetical protein